MGFFSSLDDSARRAKLKTLEDKRAAFAVRLAAQGFAPASMLFTQMADGSLAAVCAYGGQRWVILAPGLDSDADFILVSFDPASVHRQRVHVQPEGMAGIFGFGRKGEYGAEYRVPLPDGGEAVLPFVAGRTSWLECRAKNPLLATQRRRGDANVVWDLKPIESGTIEKVLALADAYLL